MTLRREVWRYLMLALAAQALLLVAAQGDSAPEITWTVSTEGEGIPEQVAPGYTVFRVDGEGDLRSALAVFRLREGATADKFQKANRALNEATDTDGIMAALNALLELADFVGETRARDGDTASFGVVLDEGTYVLEGLANGEGGMSERAYQTFTVAGEPQAEAPEAERTVQMMDFFLALPPDIRAGAQTWQVSNVGQQLHHMMLLKLNEGATVDDVMAWLNVGQYPRRFEVAGGVGLMSPGRSNYVPLDLAPGEYVAICLVPDHRGEATGQAHAMLGMVQTFTVGGE